MNIIKARNVNDAFFELAYQLTHNGVLRDSRNGPVLQLSGPTIVEYQKPIERVLFYGERDANPFFHLFESIWMLAGRNDVEFPASIVGQMSEYSDDGETYNGAYGYRWRNWFVGNQELPDQLVRIADALRENPDCRRQVLSMWDGHHDLGLKSKDLPCNTHVYFLRNADGDLDMTVCNRSNDAVWGAAGSNVVHFSILQEFMAARIGCGVGRYWQMSNNMHVYKDVHGLLLSEADRMFQDGEIARDNPYHRTVRPTKMFFRESEYDDLHDCELFCFDPTAKFSNPFLEEVAKPLMVVYLFYKNAEGQGKYDEAIALIKNHSKLIHTDWGIAALHWIERRKDRHVSRSPK